MAEARTNRLPSGHDEEFVSKVDDDCYCLICQFPLKQPVLTRCGHRFCRACLEEHLRRQETQSRRNSCPADREDLDRDRDVFPDKATERKILSLTIKCPSEGCEWNGELRNKEDHINKCNKCPVPCPNHCGDSVCREMIPQHTQSSCPMTFLSCPYAQMGCKKKVQRKNVESHLQSDMRRHLDLACVKVKSSEEATRKLAEKVERLQRQLEMKESNEVVVMDKTEDSKRVFIWKIKDFSKILEQAVSGEKEKISSAPFYTERGN